MGVINVITVKTPQAFNWAVTSEMSCPFQASAEARHGPDPVGQFQPAGLEPKKTAEHHTNHHEGGWLGCHGNMSWCLRRSSRFRYIIYKYIYIYIYHITYQIYIYIYDIYIYTVYIYIYDMYIVYLYCVSPYIYIPSILGYPHLWKTPMCRYRWSSHWKIWSQQLSGSVKSSWRHGIQWTMFVPSMNLWVVFLTIYHIHIYKYHILFVLYTEYTMYCHMIYIYTHILYVFI